jgi:hypothetical protein
MLAECILIGQIVLRAIDCGLNTKDLDYFTQQAVNELRARR